MKKLIIANWKMNPQTLAEAGEFFNSIKKGIKDAENVEVVICPPFVYLPNLKLKIKNLKLGAQDCFWENQGAYTGEISPLMLKNLGVEYVIVGHSERRNYLGETDEMIAKKIKSAFENNLIPILCVGETLEQRKKGFQKKVVQEQLRQDLEEISKLKTKNLIVAYEPVWAIGTGNFCPPKEAIKMHQFIRNFLNTKYKILNTKVIYGGSVDSKNIAGYIKYPAIDGALVGGASIKIKEFEKIINEVSQPVKTKPTPK